LDTVDKTIWILPFFAVLDAASTFYAASRELDLRDIERGLFASFFANLGMAYAYLYAVVYVLIIVGISYFMWYIKNKKLNASNSVDKVVFLILVGVTCFVYVRLTVAFVTNFFLPYLLERAINLYWLTVIVGLSALFSLGLYMWRDVLAWVNADGGEKK
jgi:magnesium-transporting ATPase (P-type)